MRRHISILALCSAVALAPAYACNLGDIVTKGSTSRSVALDIIDSTDGTPETGVVFNTSGIDLWYRREGAARTAITEATLAALTTAYSSGGFLHVSDGAYRLDVPDAAFATGANYVDIGGAVTGMIVICQRVRLVDFSLEDSVRMGMTALPNATPGASGGVQIAGSNAASTYASMTVTGNLSVGDGVTITRSTSNQPGLSVTGNGTGNGATFTSGSGATGNGAQFTAASTNGNGIGLTATGSGLTMTLTPSNVTQFGGTNGTFASGRPEVNTTHWAGTAVASAIVNANVAQISTDSVAADNLEQALDDTAGSVPWTRIVDQGTAQAATGTTLQLRSAATFADSELVGATVVITGGTTGVGQSRTITAYTGATDTATVATWTTTPTGTITYKVFAEAPGAGGAVSIAAGGITASSFASGAIDAAAIATDAIGAAEIATDAIGSAEIATDAIGAAELAANAIAAAEIASDAITAAKFDSTAGAYAPLGIVDQGTAQAATATTLQLRSAATFADSELIGSTCLITGGSAGVGQSRTITAYTGSTDTATVSTWTTTPTGTITYKCFGTAAGGGSVSIASGGITAASFAAGAIDASAIATDAIGAAEIATDAIGSAEIATDAIGAAEIAASAIGASEIADGGITATEFGTGAITATVIATDAIGAAEVAADVSTEFLTGLAGLAVNTTQISGDSAVADSLEAAFDLTPGPVQPLQIARQGTAQSATATTVVLDAAASFADDTILGMTLVACGSTQGYCQAQIVSDYVGSTDTATVGTWTVTPSGTITYYLFATAPATGGGGGGLTASDVWTFGSRSLTAATNITSTGGTIPITSSRVDASVGAYQTGLTPLQPTTAGRTLDVTATGEAGIDWANIGSPTTANNLSGTTISTSQGVASVSGAVGSVTGAVGSVTGNVGGNVVGSVASVATNGITANSVATDAVTEIQTGLATSAAIAALNNISTTDIANLVVEDQGATISLRCVLAALAAYAGGDVSTSGANSTYKDPSGSENRITGTVTSPGNRNGSITCPTIP